MKKRIKLIVNVFIIIGALLVGGFYVYTQDYYRAEVDVITVMKNESKYHIKEINNYTLVESIHSPSKQGLIFYPGGKVEDIAYLPLMEKLSEQGFTCYLVEMPFHLAIFDTGAASQIIKDNQSITNWTLVGHSLGGASASMVASQLPIDNLVLLGAYSTKDLSESNFYVLSLVGSEDGIVNRDKLKSNETNLPSSAIHKEIIGGNHAYYGNYGEQRGDGNATLTPFEQQSITAQYIGELIK